MSVMSVRSGVTVLALLSVAALAPATRAQPPVERVMEMPLAEGGRQRALLVMPDHPRAIIVMLPGGAGDVGLSRDGEIRHGDNFTVRTRALWAARGYAVLIPDTVDRANLRGLRSSARYGGVVERLIRLAHDEAAVPVFLLGTSQGSIAAMNGASHARPGDLAGVILTESVSLMGGSHETVFDADPAGVRVPALVVANRDDRCDVAPAGMAPRIAAAMTNSPRVDVRMVSGGITSSRRDCGSLTPHGYYGIEDKVVGLVGDWIQARLRG
ncbi:alpha/beta hydrolase [Acidomonas methanolica]|uniref:alpha/beta hydrolase n=1 Tax=Acidomonas methanolica TaxID=437 RepID=UPI00211A6E74|nr:lysophospholipase [Acidomonas methanolica]